MSNFLSRLTFIPLVFFTITVLPISLWMTFNFETAAGLLLGLMGISAVVALFFLWRGLASPDSFFRTLMFFFLALPLGLLLALFLMAPSGQPDPTFPLQHYFVDGRRFPRFAPLNVIPEIEQMSAGTRLLARYDRLIDDAKAERLADLTITLYQEVEADPDYRALGSAMVWPINEAVGLPFDSGHYYLYVPQNLPSDEPLPVILFLHGSGGPFKAYQKLWADFAEENGFIVASPSFGFGNWRQPGGREAIFAVLDQVLETTPADPNQVFIAGLSNGGLGVAQALDERPEQFAGAVLISPIMDVQIYREPEFYEGWDGLMLIITGEQDLRVPYAYVTQHTDLFEANGVPVTLVTFPKEDHFLFFSQAEAWREEIEKWLTKANTKTNARNNAKFRIQLL